jgi:hydroxylamine reductase (hybrid-cluster protein)
LTLGCAKNHLIHSEMLFGANLSKGVPRIMDMGPCNDLYSPAVVATELAKALVASAAENMQEMAKVVSTLPVIKTQTKQLAEEECAKGQ